MWQMPKVGVVRKLYAKKIKKEYLVSGQSLAKNISLDEEIEIPAASLRSFLHCDLETE